MSWVELAAAALGRSGIPRLLPDRGPLIVMYHGLGGRDGVDAADFGRHLDALARRRQVVPLCEAIRALGTDEAAGLAAISFDDGYHDFAEIALPVLVARDLHATLFVPASKIRDLDVTHVEIGAHGFSHCRLAELEAAHLERETKHAREVLEDALGRRVDLFAYPYGQRDDFDTRAEQAVERAGFVAACSTRFGRGSRAAERYRLRRVGVEPSDSLTTVEAKLDGSYDFVSAKEALGTMLRGAMRGLRG